MRRRDTLTAVIPSGRIGRLAFLLVCAVYVYNFLVSAPFSIDPLRRLFDSKENRHFPFTAWSLYALLPVQGMIYDRVRLRVPARTAETSGGFDRHAYHETRFPRGFLHYRLARYAASGDPRLPIRVSGLLREYAAARNLPRPTRVDLELRAFRIDGGVLKARPQEDSTVHLAPACEPGS